MNIYQKLLAIQCELKAPKSQYNSFGKYSYRNCEDILEAAKPICEKHNAVVFLTDEIEQKGERYYVKATATFVDVENFDTPPLTVTAYAREEESKKGMDGSQVTGASSSYARKYALNGLFDIDDTKDSDTTNTNGKEDKGQEQKPAQISSKKPQNKANSNKETPLSGDTKNRINAGITQYKKLAKIETKDVLAIIEEKLGFSVADVDTEEKAKQVIDLLLNMIATFKGGAA